MKQTLTLLALILLIGGCTKKSTKNEIFRLHVFTQPANLDSARARASSASYLFNNIMRGLYIHQRDVGLKSEGGECTWKSEKKLSCTLHSNVKWSNGEVVLAQDYVRAFRHLVTPSTASPRAYMLFTVKNAKAIFMGEKEATQLGVKAKDDKTFEIQFEEHDPDFYYKLTSTAFVPKHKDNPTEIGRYKNFLSNGPYIIKDWKFNQQILLAQNPHYQLGHPQRPDVLFHVVDNDMTAYRLYQQGELDFQRRVPTKLIEVNLNNKNFYNFLWLVLTMWALASP